MKKLYFLILLLCFLFSLSAQNDIAYSTLDKNNPIVFGGDHIIYQGKSITLGPKAFFIDGQLSDENVSKFEFVYNSVNEASKDLTDGTEVEPMILYIAPYVYWLDDPDDPEIKIPNPKNANLRFNVPFGLEIECEWLKLYGLNDNPRNVVLACNRGQAMGAKGNFTLMRISGQGTYAENLTFGNYCNVDLEFPLKTSLNRVKRGEAFVQAMLVLSDGDKVVSRNVRFISRLDLFPFVGAKRILFDRCHFESTDDALNPTGVYLNCTFDFYSGKPFFGTSGTGAVFLNCDIKSYTRGNQYFTKGSGQLALIDTRMESNSVSYIGWRDKPASVSRNYQHNFILNNKDYDLSKQHPYSTIKITNKPLLDAYKFQYQGKTIYNTYNLLKGDDDWDPMNIKNEVLEAEKALNRTLTSLPTQLQISQSIIKSTNAKPYPARPRTIDTIETNKGRMVLRASLKRFGNYHIDAEEVSWEIEEKYHSLIKLKTTEDGSCLVIPINDSNTIKEAIVTARTASGLEAASIINVSPEILVAPILTGTLSIIKGNQGALSVAYNLNTKYEDQSLLTWYRCSDAKGSNPIEIAVSRNNKPTKNYFLSEGDVGYYIMVSIKPKHIRSNVGEAVSATMSAVVVKNDIIKNDLILTPDLLTLSAKNQPLILPGFWTKDAYVPQERKDEKWLDGLKGDAWVYGSGRNGASNSEGFIQAKPGARMLYTPSSLESQSGNMKFSFTAVPFKTAGQGFSMAAEFMDVYIKFDAKTLSGYGVRLIRTIKYHDAIDVVMMQYKNGIAIPISKAVSTNCYRPNCEIKIEIKDNKFKVHMELPKKFGPPPNDPQVEQMVQIEEEIIGNNYGGLGFQYSRGIRSGATLLKQLKIEWF